MFTNRSTTFMFFGIIIGLCCGILIRNYQTLEIVKKCKLKPNLDDKNAFDLININPDETISNSQRTLLFVGVMTAKNFLQGRAKAVYDTWGKQVPGRISFFSSENSKSNDLPVVALKGVDDRYPPQKKSFMMLYYMYEHFIDKFEWFARTDDDVYINTRKLEQFLRSIDSSKPQFIGQAGKGNSEEFGLLSLEFDENFCMGGPGVILSRETLRRVAPHISTCLKNLYSTHEDVELGRCVQKFAGIPCTWNYEMQSILHHNSSGRYAFTGNLKSTEIHNAISLHPVKKAPLMYRLHSYIEGLRAQDILQDALSLHRDIVQMTKYLGIDSQRDQLVPGIPIYPENSDNKHYLEDQAVLGVIPDIKKFKPLSAEEVQEWNFIAKHVYSSDHPNPKRKIESNFHEGLEDIITEVMGKINNFSRLRGRVIEFREVLYGYTRVNSLYGYDVILDLLLIYKKYRGKKMTVPVRRHLYIQRTFTSTFVREINESYYNSVRESTKSSYLSDKVKDLWNTGFGKISDTLTLPIGRNVQNVNAQNKIVFILALAGRFSTFVRFLKNYEDICLKTDENTDLLIVIFKEENDLVPFYEELFNLNEKYPKATINQITIKGNFSRGKALDTAARSEFIGDHDILFFIDVDITFQKMSLDRIRQNTIENRQVYFPIVFSQYNLRKIADTDNYAANTSITNHYLSNESGYFRQFGYGICAIYKSDILNPEIDGFNTDITGWGLEDVKFLEKLIKLNHNQGAVLLNTADNEVPSNIKKIKLTIFRAPDPLLVHIFHPIECDKNLDPSQYSMCLGTKAMTLGSYRHIESQLLQNSNLINFLSTNIINNNNY